VPALKTRMVKLADAGAFVSTTCGPTPSRLSSNLMQSTASKPRWPPIQDVPWEPEPIHEVLTRVADESGVSRNKVFMPIRLALTGKKISLPIDYTLASCPKTWPCSGCEGWPADAPRHRHRLEPNLFKIGPLLITCTVCFQSSAFSRRTARPLAPGEGQGRRQPRRGRCHLDGRASD